VREEVINGLCSATLERARVCLCVWWDVDSKKTFRRMQKLFKYLSASVLESAVL
jgi:hypothetical protein